MNARELLDHFDFSFVKSDEARATILRALALLADVEESSDGLVQTLLNWKVKDWYEAMDLGEDAAARIVALERELASVKAERDGLLRGEYICRSCGLRKNGEIDATPSF